MADVAVPGVTAPPATAGGEAAPPAASATQGTTPEPTSAAADPGATGTEGDKGGRAQDRIRQVIGQRDEERTARQALEQKIQAMQQQYTALQDQLTATAQVQDRLRQVFVPPEPAIPEYIDQAQADVDALKPQLQELKQWREAQERAGAAAKLQGEIDKAREKHPVPDFAMATVIQILRAQPQASVEAAMKAVHDAVTKDRDEHVLRAKTPPPSLIDAKAPVLPADYKPKNVNDAHEMMLRLMRQARA